MSHVDDGALHAYLDGALDEYPPSEAERIRDHLDRCAECMDRLEAERRIRGDAHAFLDMASPVVEAPSLEELRAYVQRTRPERRGISRLQRLGWAASVMLALGTGWMLREGQIQTGVLNARQEGIRAPASGTAFEASPARTVADERVPSEETAVVRSPADAAPSTVAAAEPALSSVAARSDDAGAEAQEEGRMVVTPGASSADADAPVPAGTAQLVAPEPVDRARLEEEVAVGNALADADTLIVGEDDQDALSLSADVVAEAELPPDVVESDTAAVAKAVAQEVAAESTEAARRRAREASVVTSELRRDVGAPPAARPAAARQAEDSTAVASLAVPGYPVISVTNLGNGTTPWGVRVLQGLAGGETFEVFHLEPGVDPSILSDLAPGRNEARMETTDGWIVARGAVSQAELAELLQRLFPQAP